MYDYFEDRMCMAPASGKEHFHYAHSGGYVKHILHVVKMTQKVSDLLVEVGGTKNYTDEELIFAALHHDLGKIGDLEYDYYIPQESDWHVKIEEKSLLTILNLLIWQFQIEHCGYFNILEFNVL